MPNERSIRHAKRLAAPWLAAGAIAMVACGSDDEGGAAGAAPREAESTPREVAAANDAPSAPTQNRDPIAAPPQADAAAPKSPAPFDMRTWRPSAKGLWIWYLDYVGMTAAQAAAKAQSLGVGYVLIKSGQDTSFWPQRFNASIVKEFTSRGLRVLAWPYVTPSGGAGAIDAAVQAANVPGCDGLVLDVEIEWEQNGDHTADAQALCQGIRAKAPGVWLAYTSFGWIGQHPGLPWTTFDSHCGDAYFPQVYFADRGVSWNGSKGLPQALADYAAAKLKAPLWPIGSNDDVYGTNAAPTSAAINGFLAAAGDYTSLYEFPDKTRPEKLTQLSQLAWKN
jgi:hypothetical protein